MPPPVPELVAPAGTPEKLQTALLYGADAVYCAGREFGLRAHAGNFSDDELAEAAVAAHARDRRLYVAVNIFAADRDMAKLPAYLAFLQEIGIDALIIADPGVLRLARQHAPALPITLSTQANCTNSEAARFWKEQDVHRIVHARELSLDEIRTIAGAADVELETFIHGALCVSWSGRCFISRYLAGRDANCGDCTQSCRWDYSLIQSERPGQHMPIEEDGRGTYFFNAKDLCLAAWVPDLMQAGVAAFKIEGRMKSVSYVASTVAVYRDVIDTYRADPGAAAKSAWAEELAKTATRDLTEGFIRGHDLPEDYDTEQVVKMHPAEFCGVVTGHSADSVSLDVRNQFRSGDTLEFLLPGLDLRQVPAGRLHSARAAGRADTVNPGDTCTLAVPFTPPIGTIVRRMPA